MVVEERPKWLSVPKSPGAEPGRGLRGPPLIILPCHQRSLGSQSGKVAAFCPAEGPACRSEGTFDPATAMPLEFCMSESLGLDRGALQQAFNMPSTAW